MLGELGYQSAIQEHGIAVVRRVVDARIVADLNGRLDQLAKFRSHPGNRRRGGIREASAVVAQFAEVGLDTMLDDLVVPILGDSSRLVRATVFDKTRTANWAVFWHQDISIAVEERHDVPGFEEWSVKDETPHVQPPVDILEQMLAIRIHLDDCTVDAGPLNVIPDSHKLRRLIDSAIRDFVSNSSSPGIPQKK